MTAPAARLVTMPPDVVARWRDERAAAGSPLPDADDTDLLAFEVVVDDMAVGGMLLSLSADGDRLRATIRLLQTTVPDDATQVWAAVLDAVEAVVRRRGARTLVTAVPPRLAAAFGAAGFRATMTGVGITVEPDLARVLEDRGQVRVREMTATERHRFAVEAGDLVRADMERSGVMTPGGSMAEVEQRLAGLVGSPPPEELLLTATVDGAAVGRFWGTLVPRQGTEGTADLVGNTIDLFPRHRGRGLMRPFMAALETHVREHDLRDVRGRLYGHATAARTTLVGLGVGIDDVHLRKDLA